MDDAKLRTVWQQRQQADTVAPLSLPLANLMKRTLAKRVRQLARLAAVWEEVVPPQMADHTALQSYQRSILTVLVDSAPHRFQLQTLLAGGLLMEIRRRFSGPLDKVKLLPGRF